MGTVQWETDFRRTLTIASAATESDVLDLAGLGARSIWGLNIISPTTLPDTVKIHVSDIPAGTFQVLQSGGTDITIPAGKSTQLDLLTIGALKLVAGSAVGADRDFRIIGGLVN